MAVAHRQVGVKPADDRVSEMSSSISERNSCGNDPGRIVLVKLEDSVQLQTILALYDQETVRNNGQPSYSRLKTSVRLHIDQTMRTRNFSAQSEVCVDRGAVTKSQKGKKANAERRVGACFQRKHLENVWKETHVVSFMNQPLETVSQVMRDNRPLPHQIRRPRLTAREKKTLKRFR